MSAEDAYSGSPAPGDSLEKAGANEDCGGVLTIEELEACDVLEMARDKFQSRKLQRSFMRGGVDAGKVIYKKAAPHFMQLVRDEHGNFLAQKVLEVATKEQFDDLFDSMKGRLVELAQDTHGTRAVQKMVEQAVSRGKTEELLQNLTEDMVEQLARSITGFHVVVKLLELLSENQEVPILIRLCGSAEKAQSLGTDQWGCCVLKKCIDRAEGDTEDVVINSIIERAPQLMQDPFGNYVVQHLITNKRELSISLVVDSLKGKVFDLSLQKFASNVLEKCLLNSGDEDRVKIIHEILNPTDISQEEAVKTLLFNQYGNYVFQQALEVAVEPELSQLIQHSKPHVVDLVQHVPVEMPSKGNLIQEHARRLALKLFKKYPVYAEGTSVEAMEPMGRSGGGGHGGGQVGWADTDTAYVNAYQHAMQSYGMGYGLDPAFGSWSGPVFPYPPFMDPSFAYPFAYPPAGLNAGRGGGKAKAGAGPGAAAGGGGTRRGNRAGNRGKERGPEASALGQPPGKGAGAAAEGAGAAAVGRIVGYWPHYSITYDESAAGAGKKGGAASKEGEPGAKAKARKPKKSGEKSTGSPTAGPTAEPVGAEG